ncbi:MAG: hypothetical protein OEV93_01540 [Candidatus Moranbacteria bacterium]|nr:hypothetical protein [Candidatus Moranbacteria bacterium]
MINGSTKPQIGYLKMIDENEKKHMNVPRKKLMVFFGFFFFLWITFGTFSWVKNGNENIFFDEKSDWSEEGVLGERTENSKSRIIAQANPEEVGDVDENNADGNVDTEVDSLKSESYNVSQIRFGTAVAIDSGSLGSVPLEVSGISGEVLISGEDETPRFLVAWKTSKDAKCEVTYSKGDGDETETYREDAYGINHAALLSDIELSTIYAYNIKARDRWGNEVASEYFSVYTGDKSESIFDLIISAIENTFGWAMKK